VSSGKYLPDDARAVLHAYFEGNVRWQTTAVPSAVLECPPGEPAGQAQVVDA
jgi:hypothetical protein